MSTLATVSLVVLLWTLVSIPLGLLVGRLFRFSDEMETTRPTEAAGPHKNSLHLVADAGAPGSTPA